MLIHVVQEFWRSSGQVYCHNILPYSEMQWQMNDMKNIAPVSEPPAAAFQLGPLQKSGIILLGVQSERMDVNDYLLYLKVPTSRYIYLLLPCQLNDTPNASLVIGLNPIELCTYTWLNVLWWEKSVSTSDPTSRELVFMHEHSLVSNHRPVDRFLGIQ